MELIRDWQRMQPDNRGCVVTIGNFDGVHLGHQHLLAALKEKANQLKLPTALVTFEPLPHEYFALQNIWPRLTRLREKYRCLLQYEIQHLICLRFDSKLASMTAEQFIQRVLINAMNVKHVVIGDDFHFGYQREGNFAMLQQTGQRLGFQVSSVNTFLIEGQRVSSRRVREELARGNLEMVKKLLGRAYTLTGRVVKGEQRGRILGFPTANVHVCRNAVPLLGVFAVKVHGLHDSPINGVANLGNRPTVDGKRILLEVHLFDFAEEIYGRNIEVEFATKLRDEQRFPDLSSLQKQISHDAEQAKQFFAA